MEGGRLLGEGSYGCAFTPPLICADGKQRNSRLVGKITSKGDALQELDSTKILRTMPLAKNYFLLPEPEFCVPAPKSEQKDSELKLCAPLDVERRKDEAIHMKDTYQIFQPFGGTLPLYKLLDSGELHPNRFDFYSFMQHLLEAGGTMLLAGVCHGDLHVANLLADNKGVVRILDFGFAVNRTDINLDHINEGWRALHFSPKEGVNEHVLNALPPEITVMTAIHEKRMSYEKAIHLTIAGKPIFRDMEKYLGISKHYSYTELLRFWQSSAVAQKEDWAGFWKLYWTGFDAWSLGTLFLTFLKLSLSWPQFGSGPWRERQKTVLPALQGMLETSPKKRLDCIEALAVFDPANSWLQQFGTKWLEQRKKQKQSL